MKQRNVLRVCLFLLLFSTCKNSSSRHLHLRVTAVAAFRIQERDRFDRSSLLSRRFIIEFHLTI